MNVRERVRMVPETQKQTILVLYINKYDRITSTAHFLIWQKINQRRNLSKNEKLCECDPSCSLKQVINE